MKRPEDKSDGDQKSTAGKTQLSESFVRKARHDLRSPLTVIKGAAELLRTASADSNQQLFDRSLGRIDRAVVEMQNIIDRTFRYDSNTIFDETEVSSPNTDKKKRLDLAGSRILLAEDKEINRQVIAELLRSYGLSVTAAVNGREVIEKFAKKSYDLILMDIEMPEVDGIEATRNIRETIRGKSVPIIALSAHTESVFREQCNDAGMDGYLLKPINPSELRRILSEWLGGEQDQKTIPHEYEQVEVKKDDLLEPKDGLERIAGNVNLYNRLLSRFIEEHADTKEQIWSKLDHDDVTEAIRIVHNLKSISGNLGLKAVSSQSAYLEDVLQKNRFDDLAPTISLLGELLNDSVSSIREYLNSSFTETTTIAENEVLPLDIDKLTLILDLIDDDISQAIELASELKIPKLGPKMNHNFDKLRTALDRFEVETAKVIIEEIIEMSKEDRSY
ncbi:MAG: response regulator [Desulfobulbia bacterium]